MEKDFVEEFHSLLPVVFQDLLEVTERTHKKSLRVANYKAEIRTALRTSEYTSRTSTLNHMSVLVTEIHILIAKLLL
jgi:hypothetical protein